MTRSTVQSLTAVGAENVVLTDALGDQTLTFTSVVDLPLFSLVDVDVYGLRFLGIVDFKTEPYALPAGDVRRGYSATSYGAFFCSRMVRAVSSVTTNTGFGGYRSMNESYVVRLRSAQGISYDTLLSYIAGNVAAQVQRVFSVSPSLRLPPLPQTQQVFWLTCATFKQVFAQHVIPRYPFASYRFTREVIEVLQLDEQPLRPIGRGDVSGKSTISGDVNECAGTVRFESVNCERLTAIETLDVGDNDIDLCGIMNGQAMPAKITCADQQLLLSVDPETGEGTTAVTGVDIGNVDEDFDTVRISVQNVDNLPAALIAIAQDVRMTVEVAQAGKAFQQLGVDIETGFIDDTFGKVAGTADRDRDCTGDMQEIVANMHEQLSQPVVGGQLVFVDRHDVRAGECVNLVDHPVYSGMRIPVAMVEHDAHGCTASLTAVNADYVRSRRIEREASKARAANKTRGGLK